MINFPNSPAINDIFTSGSSSWKWDGVKWVPLSGSAILTGDGVNILRRNGGFEVWQRGAGGNASFAIAASTPGQYTADGWYIYNNANQALTVTQAAVTAGTGGWVAGGSAVGIRRNVGQTGIAPTYFGFPLDTGGVGAMQGKFVRLSFMAAAGSTYSTAGGLLSCQVFVGTGNPTKLLGGAGYTGQTAVLTVNANLTNTAQRFQSTSPLVIPAGTKQAEVTFFWTPVGTAGADDSIFIDGVQLEIVPAATGYVSSDFQRLNLEEQLLLCQRHYFKTFRYATAPAQNVGVDTGEIQMISARGASLGMQMLMRFPVKMRNTPTLTFFNPAAANAFVRDEIAGADGSGTAATATEDVARHAPISSASTAVGNLMGIHMTAEAGI